MYFDLEKQCAAHIGEHPLIKPSLNFYRKNPSVTTAFRKTYMILSVNGKLLGLEAIAIV